MSEFESKVGYKNPPRHSQFKKGQSGNPKGRPKNGRGLKTDLKAELVSKMNIRMNGKDVSGTKQQLMLRTLTVRAASGDISATRVLINLVMQVLGPEDHESGPKRLSNLDQEILNQLLGRRSSSASTPTDGNEMKVNDETISDESSKTTDKGDTSAQRTV